LDVGGANQIEVFVFSFCVFPSVADSVTEDTNTSPIKEKVTQSAHQSNSGTIVEGMTPNFPPAEEHFDELRDRTGRGAKKFERQFLALLEINAQLDRVILLLKYLFDGK